MKRIQRKRTKGWKMPPNTVYVGRPTKWGNPFRLGDPDLEAGGMITRQKALDLYETWLMNKDLSELKGKDLACWCSLDEPCHADVLLQMANDSVK